MIGTPTSKVRVYYKDIIYIDYFFEADSIDEDPCPIIHLDHTILHTGNVRNIYNMSSFN